MRWRVHWLPGKRRLVASVRLARLSAPGGGSRRSLRKRASRHRREEWTQSFRHGGVGEYGVAKPRVGQVRHHRHLYHRHDLTGLGTDHREPENAILARSDEGLHEAL